MIYKNRLLINSDELAGIDNILNGEEELPEDETITYTTVFPDGKEMDIKVCGCEASEGGAWTEAVLFNESGSELCCTDCMEGITGEWELEYDGNSYICVVEDMMIKIRYNYYNSENFKIAYINKDSISSISITENMICMNNGGLFTHVPEEDLLSILHFFEHNV